MDAKAVTNDCQTGTLDRNAAFLTPRKQQPSGHRRFTRSFERS